MQSFLDLVLSPIADSSRGIGLTIIGTALCIVALILLLPEKSTRSSRTETRPASGAKRESASSESEGTSNEQAWLKRMPWWGWAILTAVIVAYGALQKQSEDEEFYNALEDSDRANIVSWGVTEEQYKAARDFTYDAYEPCSVATTKSVREMADRLNMDSHPISFLPWERSWRAASDGTLEVSSRDEKSGLEASCTFDVKTKKMLRHFP